MRVPVPGAKLPRSGASGHFLYKRNASHYHQGLDIGALHDPETSEHSASKHKELRLAGVLPILSVCDGRVMNVRPDDTGTYGRIVVVRGKAAYRGEMRELWFLYSHCNTIERTVRVGENVSAGQKIATVGWSGNAGRANPHLHFEVSTEKLPADKGDETTPHEQRRRINPEEVLRAMPPFPADTLFRPDQVAELSEIEQEKLHILVATQSGGGFFPLGANNTWHGGVHIPMSVPAQVVAPMDGEIVAVRLDPDPVASQRQFGSANFILMRHELSSSVYEHIRGETPSKPSGGSGASSGKRPGVGGKHDNDPALVDRVRQKLSEKGLYPPDPDAPPPAIPDEEGTIEPELVEAIEAFQETIEPPKNYKPWPDGSMRYEGFTWDTLFADDASHDGGPDDPRDDTHPEVTDEDLGPTDDSELPHPPPGPSDPKRVVYSLFMHLGAHKLSDKLAKRFAWLQDVRVFRDPDDTPPGIEDAVEAERKHREDVAEAASHRLRKHVGKGDEDEDDVRWVRTRLVRFDLLNEDDGSGTMDEALRDAIVEFQETHVYAKKPDKADGVVSRGRKTDKTLRKSRRQLGLDTASGPSSIQPLFAALLAERGVDGMTRVVSGLHVPVLAGSPLWSAGSAAHFGDDGRTIMKGQLHWEVFSEHPIFVDGHDGWDSIIDPDEDLTADAPRALLDLVTDWPTAEPGFAVLPDNGIIDAGELEAFYQAPESKFLRRRQCQFRTEWGLDVGETVKRLETQGWAAADQIGVALLPYQWWHDAADVLPRAGGDVVRHVWHYNPIEFIGTIQAALDAVGPPEPKDPKKYGGVQITVFNKHGARAGKVDVTLTDAEGTEHVATTAKPHRNGQGGGVVDFFDVAKGLANIELSLAGETFGPISEFVFAGVTLNEFVIPTSLEGPLPPRGHIAVTVRRSGAVFKDPVEIQLVSSLGTVVQTGTSKNAKLKFENVLLGDYVLRSVDGESQVEHVSLDRIRTANGTVRRHRHMVRIVATVLHEETPVAGVIVRVTHAKGGEQAVGGLGRTRADGTCTFDVRHGGYHVRVGKKRKKHVHTGKPLSEVTLSLRSMPVAEPEFARVEIEVKKPEATARIAVTLASSSNPHAPLFERYLNPASKASFEVPAGTYVAHYAGRTVEVSAPAGAFASAVLE